MILQKEIAEKAGVSYATVSRALTRSAKVRPETMRRIREAMKELGIDSTEAIFRSGNAMSRMVLLVVGDLGKEFYAKNITGLCRILDQAGYTVVLCSSGYDPERELQALRQAEQNGWAGIVMLTAVESDALVQFLQKAQIPMVFLNRYIRSMDLDIVRIDNYRGGYLAACHLLDQGHRKIAHLAGLPNSSAVQDRVRGFTDALAEFAGRLIGEDYTAAFIGNDHMTAGTVYQLLRKGKRIPEDISILSFDDSPSIGREGLNITSISFDPETMGKAAAELLLKRIADPLGEHTRIIYSPTLKLRGSVRKLEERAAHSVDSSSGM